MKKEMITIKGKDGIEREAELVLCFESEETGKKYVIYTFNEIDEKGMVALYSSIAIETDEKTTFKNIESEEEWAMVKEVMKKIIVGWKEQ